MASVSLPLRRFVRPSRLKTEIVSAEATCNEADHHDDDGRLHVEITFQKWVVELRGIEPLTSSLRTKRSTN